MPITADQLSPSVIERKKLQVTLTHADIKNIFNPGVELLPAPPVGMIYVPEWIYAEFDTKAGAYSFDLGAPTIQIVTGDATYVSLTGNLGTYLAGTNFTAIYDQCKSSQGFTVAALANLNGAMLLSGFQNPGGNIWPNGGHADNSANIMIAYSELTFP